MSFLDDLYDHIRNDFTSNPGLTSEVSNPENHVHNFQFHKSVAGEDVPIWIIVGFPTISGTYRHEGCMLWTIRVPFLIGWHTAVSDSNESAIHFARIVGGILEGLESNTGKGGHYAVMAIEEIAPAERDRLAVRDPERNDDWEIGYALVISGQ